MAPRKKPVKSPYDSTMKNVDLKRALTPEEIKEAQSHLAAICSGKTEGIVVVIGKEKLPTSSPSVRQERTTGIVFGAGMSKAEILTAILESINATPLEVFAAAGANLRQNPKAHKHDEHGNCLD